jgi:hypothetical protein
MEDSRAERDRAEPRNGRINKLKSAAADEVRSSVESGAGVAASTLGDMADALRRAGDELADRDRTGAAGIAQSVARGLGGFAQSLGERSADDLADDIRRFGRSNPTAFIGLSLLAGFAIGRLLTSSTDETNEGVSTRPNGIDRPETGYPERANPMGAPPPNWEH